MRREEVRPHYHALVHEDALPLVAAAGGTLLDVGGGTGATALRLRTMGHAQRAGVIDRVAPLTDLDFAHAGDVEDPAFLDHVLQTEGPFQTILCLDILEHLRDPWAVVERLHSGLAPGGAIVASIPNIRNFTALMPLVLRNRWDLRDAGVLDRTHLRFFVRDSAIGLMTSSGLALEAVRAKPSGGRKVRLFRALTCGLLNSFTDLQYLIRVRNTGIAPGSEVSCAA